MYLMVLLHKQSLTFSLRGEKKIFDIVILLCYMTIIDVLCTPCYYLRMADEIGRNLS